MKKESTLKNTGKNNHEPIKDVDGPLLTEEEQEEHRKMLEMLRKENDEFTKLGGQKFAEQFMKEEGIKIIDLGNGQKEIRLPKNTTNRALKNKFKKRFSAFLEEV